MAMLRTLFALGLCFGAVRSRISGQDTLESGRAESQQNLPVVKLPYGSYRAKSYIRSHDVYVFKNIRFAAPPLGALRFAKPSPPGNFTGVQNGDGAGTCYQSLPAALLGTMTGNEAVGGLAKGLLGNVDMGKMMGGGVSSEDCLFLDVIVPGKALRGEVKLPVLNWIYGGAYILGNKEGMYDGRAIVKSSGGNVIWVAGNYRLGLFGWLAGNTIEKDKTAISNAGLWDQRAVLEWIQQHISPFGGDPKNVTAMGESAGASSLLAHLTQFGGQKDTLFRRAIIQSAAFAPNTWDRRGANEDVFKLALKHTGCTGKGIQCLRAADSKTLKAVMDKMVEEAFPGTFGFGLSVDGGFVRQLPQLELVSGNFAKNVESVIVSHTSDEADMFTSKRPHNDTTFRAYIDWSFANSSIISDAALKYFPLEKFSNARDRLKEYSRLSTFTCSSRFIAQAYQRDAYAAQYAGPHGMDITADFYDASTLSGMLTATSKASIMKKMYQKYLISYIRTGNPNAFKEPTAPDWPKVRVGPEVGNTLEVDAMKPFQLVNDVQNMKAGCDFVIDMFAQATNSQGYAPPGGVVKSRLGSPGPNASSKFLPT